MRKPLHKFWGFLPDPSNNMHYHLKKFIIPTVLAPKWNLLADEIEAAVGIRRANDANNICPIYGMLPNSPLYSYLINPFR